MCGELSIYLSACLPARQDVVTEDQRPSRHYLGRASLINIWREIISWVIAHFFYELMFCKQEKTDKNTEQGMMSVEAKGKLIP